MRTLATLVCLLIPLACAVPAQAQGFDKDKLEELVEKATSDPNKKKAEPKAEKKTKYKKKKKKKKKGDKAKAADAKGEAQDGEVAKPKSDRVLAKEWRKLLAKRKATVAFARAPLTEVLEFLGKKAELKIVLSKKALEEHGKKPVTLRQKSKVTLRICLDVSLSMVSEDLVYGVKDGAIWIGLAKEADGLKLTKL